jgi:hypothetical protein
MRSSVIVKATFPGTSLAALDVHMFEIVRQPLAMDVMKMTFISSDERFVNELASGSPVHMKWTARPQGDEFYGYVYSVRPKADQLERRVEIICMGVFMTMLTPYTQTYPNMCPHHAVAEVMDAHRLHLNYYTSNEVGTFTQEAESDWEFVHTLARSIGYVTVIDRASMTFYPLDLYWKQSLRYQRPLSSFSVAAQPESSLMTFEHDEADARSAYEYNVNEELGILTYAKTGELKGLKTDRDIRTMFPNRAKGTILGPPRILPLDAFEITHDGQRHTWAALKVTYRYDATAYRAEVDFGSDGRWVPPPTSANTLDVPTKMLTHDREPVTPVLEERRPIYVGPSSAQNLAMRWAVPVLMAPNVMEMTA